MARVRGGTLVLDEVSDLPPEAQGRVVRMMDAPGEHAPRFMATSRVPPVEGARGWAAARGSLLPAERGDDRGAGLRDRIEDIDLLAGHFLGRDRAPARPSGIFPRTRWR